MNAKNKQICFICYDCAKENGGKPKEIMATMHIGECDICNLTKPLLSTGDFDYPKIPLNFSNFCDN